jgi:hypothetical protein
MPPPGQATRPSCSRRWGTGRAYQVRLRQGFSRPLPHAEGLCQSQGERAVALSPPCPDRPPPGHPFRLDALHQTTTMLTSRYETVGEDLNVAGMPRNWRLAQGPSDQSSERARHQLDSKSCSGCKTVNAGRSLAERISRCEDATWSSTGRWGPQKLAHARRQEQRDRWSRGKTPPCWARDDEAETRRRPGPHEASFVGFPATGQLMAVGRELSLAH